jgi:hypothetical protein
MNHAVASDHVGTFRFQQEANSLTADSEIIRPACCWTDCVSNAMTKAVKCFVQDFSHQAGCSGALLRVGCSASFPSPDGPSTRWGTSPLRLWLANATPQTLHVLRSPPFVLQAYLWELRVATRGGRILLV